jgi:hypothetical protein
MMKVSLLLHYATFGSASRQPEPAASDPLLGTVGKKLNEICDVSVLFTSMINNNSGRGPQK